MAEKRVVALDDSILLTKATYEAWLKVAQSVAPKIIDKGIDANSIPDEKFEIQENGLDAKIFWEMPGVFRVELDVPDGHWAWTSN